MGFKNDNQEETENTPSTYVGVVILVGVLATILIISGLFAVFGGQ
jgi:hypothetical protein